MSFIILFFGWLLLSGKFDLFHMALGVISCILVTIISSELFFRQRQIGLSRRLGEAMRFVVYCFWLLYQIGIANLHVVALALSPKFMANNFHPHIFTFKTSLKGDFAKFVLANSITLTPGTVTIRIDNDIFIIHAISKKAAGDLAEKKSMSEMEQRVAWVFERDLIS
ncbi:MAG: Na+/H+ antiporter subunit E [Thermodesulfobacteriota bacterium]